MIVSILPRPAADEARGPFVVGSAVKLKGGGEVMTVLKPGKTMVEVEWHNANGDPVSYRYPPPMLRHHDPDEEAKEKDESPK